MSRYLLDGLRSEEQDRYRAGILAHFGLTPKVNPKNVDKTIANQAKGLIFTVCHFNPTVLGYMNTAGRPLLDAVFGGTLLQTIRCCQCGHVSERQEQVTLFHSPFWFYYYYFFLLNFPLLVP